LTGFPRLVSALQRSNVRFVLIGVAGANHWARSGAAIFTTQDFDLFLPPAPDNALAAWEACRSLGLELWNGNEPLGTPQALAGREKDRLFLASHAEALRDLMEEE
jgi:hypothetical protein